MLLENLNDEEKGSENHPELWLRFAEGLGLSREQVLCSKAEPAIQNVINTFFKNTRSSAAEGLGVLYAYESQIPAIAKFKIEALKKFYLTENTAASERALQFFKVHETADAYHTETLKAVIENFSPEERQLCEKAALEGACALWGFLDAMPA
jgi:pyrroloquinoline-quinone synthase